MPIKLLSSEEVIKNEKILEQTESILKHISDGNLSIRDEGVDSELIERLYNGNAEETAKAILELVYYIRCNVSYGQKTFRREQKRILQSSNEILIEINKMMFNKLT